MPSSPSLDIVIVSYNARDVLRQCLESLRDHPPQRDCTVIVVDNASSDGSPSVVREVLPDATLIPLQENVGFAAGNNCGIRAGKSPLVLLLNSDTVVPAGALDRLIDALETCPAAACAGPRLKDADGRVEVSFGAMMSPWNELRQKTLGRFYDRGVAPARWIVERRAARPGFVDWVSGACLLVRRPDAEAVGLLDERYFMYAEDVDFCAALRARGRGVLFTPVAEIVHLRGRSRQSAPDATGGAYRRSQVAFYAKHHPRWARLLEWYLKLKGDWPANT